MIFNTFIQYLTHFDINVFSDALFYILFNILYVINASQSIINCHVIEYLNKFNTIVC